MSSVKLSNDTLEGKLVAASIKRLADRDQLPQQTANRIQENIRAIENIFDGLVFCLSEDGDLLSQWRGYSNDGTGLSIGFSVDYLKWLSNETRNQNGAGFSLQSVEYDPQSHDMRIEKTYQEIKKRIDEGAFRIAGLQSVFDSRTPEEIKKDNLAIETALQNYSLTIMTLFSELYRLKSFAFKEEREWRLLSYLLSDMSNGGHYRSAKNRIVPYRIISLLELDRHPIVDVVVGPKHITPLSIVLDALKANHFGNVNVRLSSASYR